ncbi:phosphotransferase [Streptomyces rubiginosohelvolus]|uniref:phosphotransferase n=1 Tax=Streptomyces rubiginosohelvolus TaxID=67362 RepID=UPI0036ADF34E
MTDRLHELFSVDDHDVDFVSDTFALGKPLSWEPCGGGLVNSNFRLETSTGTYLLRCYPDERTASEVMFEVSLLGHLDRVGFPGPVPVSIAGGDHVGTLRGRLFTVLTYIKGATVTQDELSVDLAEQVGQKYAQFRRAVAGFRPAGARENPDVREVGELMESLLADLHGSHPAEAALVASSWAAVQQLFSGAQEGPFEVLHGDLFYENVIVEAGRLVTFIDYDDAYLGLPLLDLALVVMEFATPPDNRMDPDLAAAVLRAFREHGGEPTPSPADLLDALTFLCCKFMAYTLPLNLRRGENITDNDYFRRLEHLRDDTRRRALGEALALAAETGA